MVRLGDKDSDPTINLKYTVQEWVTRFQKLFEAGHQAGTADQDIADLLARAVRAVLPHHADGVVEKRLPGGRKPARLRRSPRQAWRASAACSSVTSG